MSDPNSKSSDILSDGPVKDILRPGNLLYKIKLKQSNFERNRKNILGFENFSSIFEKNCLGIFREFLS